MMWWYVQTVYFIPTVRLICEAPGFPMWNRSVSSADRGVGEKNKKGVGWGWGGCLRQSRVYPENWGFFTAALQQLQSTDVWWSPHTAEVNSDPTKFTSLILDVESWLEIIMREIIDEERNGRWHMPNPKSLISVSPTLLFLVWFNFLPLPPTRLLRYSAAKEWIKSKQAIDRHFWPTVHLSVCVWVLPADTRSLDDVKIVQKVCVNSFAVKKHYYLITLSVCSHLEKSYSVV